MCQADVLSKVMTASLEIHIKIFKCSYCLPSALLGLYSKEMSEVHLNIDYKDQRIIYFRIKMLLKNELSHTHACTQLPTHMTATTLEGLLAN